MYLACNVYLALNLLECTGNYSATSNDMKLVHWPLMGGLITFCTVRRGLGGSDILISKTKTRMIDFSNTETKTNTKMIMKTETI